MHCYQCQMLSINGLPCHEHGCPNMGKRWVKDRQEWVRFYECWECGDDIEEGESCDCDEDREPTAIEQLAARVGADPEDSDFIFGMVVFCWHYHGGQWSVEYQAQCEANARISDRTEKAICRGKDDPAGEWEEARIWYRALKREHESRNSRLSN